MTRPFWRRRVAATVLALAIVGAVVVLAVSGSREPASALRLLTGDVWLENSLTGTVSHVLGYSGATDAQAAVGRAGDPFEVVQRASGAYVLDLRTGRLSRLDNATLHAATAAQVAEPADALQIITGDSATWILDRSSGILQPVNPTTLRPIGHQIPLGGPTGIALADQSGSVWAPVRSDAVVDQVTPGGGVTRHPFGHPGNEVQVAATAAGVWAVDPQTATAASLSVQGVHPVALPAMPASPLIGSSASSPNLVLVTGTQVLDINTSLPSLSSLVLPAAAQTTQVAVASGRAYLLDTTAGKLDTVNLSPIRVLASVPVPRGANQLVTKDQLVFVNSSATAEALVVGPNGSVTDLIKYSVPTRINRGHSSGARGGPPALVPSPVLTPPSGPPAFVPPVTGPSGPQVPPVTYPHPLAPPTTRPSSPATLPPTVPGAPNVNQVTAGNGLIRVTWSPPASDGGSPVLRYQVTGSPTSDSRSVPASTNAATLTGLANGTRECVQIQAVNRVGGGPLSPAGRSCATPLANSPGPVGGVTARDSAPRQVTLSWKQPSLGPYHTPIKSYRVLGGTAPVTAATTSAVVSGLANSKTYTFTVTATNTAGVSGPASAPITATTWSPPGAVAHLSVTGGDRQVKISWGAATVAKGSPNVTSYQLSVNGKSQSTTSTTVTEAVPAWNNETITVYAVSSVGSGQRSSATGMAWARTTTVTCWDSLSGDRSVQNDCTNTGGAWSQHSSRITWIDVETNTGHRRPAGTFEYLCTTYESGPVSGDVYALVSTPTARACTAALPGYQPPDTPHVIAAVSKTRIDPGSQQICEWAGTTTGTSPGTWKSEELVPCGSSGPAGMTGAKVVNRFWT